MLPQSTLAETDSRKFAQDQASDLKQSRSYAKSGGNGREEVGLKLSRRSLACRPTGCRLVRRADADWCVLSALTVELGLDVLRVAIRTNAVGERRFEALLDVALERFPFVALVPDPLAIRTDGKESFELLQLAA